MTPPRNLGIYINALPFDLIRKYTVMAEAHGFASVWYPEITFNDAFTALTTGAVDTERVQLGTAVVGPWGRSPAVTALSLATLSTLSQGRVVLGLGTQARPYVENWHGRDYQRPLTAMREYITIVRAALAGECVTFEGDIFHVKNFQLAFPPEQPAKIYMAAVGPKMIELAAEIADGVMGAFYSVGYVEQVVMPRVRAGAARAGRSLDDFTVCNELPTLVHDGDDAFALHKGQVLQYATAELSSPAYHTSVACAGFGEVLEEIKVEVAARNYDRVFDLISPEMVDALSFTGTPDHIRARMNEYYAAGVDQVQVHASPPGGYYPFYEGHLDGAPFPEFDFPGFLRSVEDAITRL